MAPPRAATASLVWLMRALTMAPRPDFPTTDVRASGEYFASALRVASTPPIAFSDKSTPFFN